MARRFDANLYHLINSVERKFSRFMLVKQAVNLFVDNIIEREQDELEDEFDDEFIDDEEEEFVLSFQDDHGLKWYILNNPFDELQSFEYDGITLERMSVGVDQISSSQLN